MIGVLRGCGRALWSVIVVTACVLVYGMIGCAIGSSIGRRGRCA
jgi:hypothetical protein